MLKRLFALAGALVTLAVGFLAALPYWPLRSSHPEQALVIEQGASLARVAREIEARGVAPAWVVRAVARLRGSAARLRSGTYRIEGRRTVGELLEAIENGEALVQRFTLVEGATLIDLVAALQELARPPVSLRLDGLDRLEQLHAEFSNGTASAEGWFFPDTYWLVPGGSARTLLRTMHERMKQELDRAWQARAPDLPLRTPHEALILASLIEKETGRDAERPLIASVFINRLRLGMPLQSDPTVIYGLGARFDGNLRKRDLRADTPYNTYVRGGLPPTPIAMPGRASLRAAVAPAETDYLYFVARGDGTSEFSRSLAEHNRAVARYQLKP
ncbi:MAG: endolytic transglycosylase MltG [Casimicrobiaceae bacterium]|nr:endolytic transglycosylase MltG [Casimicrobiaceae bacterium]MCX8099124.1 endolytic transglycosylase MltG [Casimicrobiaceae bacterium]MDW8312191.1 endolytic transglycosylase MltG [Burkholderiales bacterium]